MVYNVHVRMLLYVCPRVQVQEFYFSLPIYSTFVFLLRQSGNGNAKGIRLRVAITANVQVYSISAYVSNSKNSSAKANNAVTKTRPLSHPCHYGKGNDFLVHKKKWGRHGSKVFAWNVIICIHIRTCTHTQHLSRHPSRCKKNQRVI